MMSLLTPNGINRLSIPTTGRPVNHCPVNQPISSPLAESIIFTSRPRGQLPYQYPLCPLSHLLSTPLHDRRPFTHWIPLFANTSLCAEEQAFALPAVHAHHGLSLTYTSSRESPTHLWVGTMEAFTSRDVADPGGGWHPPTHAYPRRALVAAHDASTRYHCVSKGTSCLAVMIPSGVLTACYLVTI